MDEVLGELDAETQSQFQQILNTLEGSLREGMDSLSFSEDSTGEIVLVDSNTVETELTTDSE